MTDLIYPPGASALPVSAVTIGGSFVITWPAAVSAIVTNGTYQLALVWPWNSGAITSLSAKTGNGSFLATVQTGGATVPGLGGVTVNSAVPMTVAAGLNAVNAGSSLTLIISGASGSPSDATVQINYIHTQI